MLLRPNTKEGTHTLHRSPKEGGEEFVTEEWQGSYVIIDPTPHDVGQRIAVENDVVGRPTAIMKKLRRALNERPDAPFQIEIEPIFDPNTFWSFAYDHGGVLRSVAFDFVVPNMWGTETDLEKELQSTREDTGAERVRIGLESRHGVDVDSERIKNGVGYAQKGAGKINAKSLDGDAYSSESEPTVTRIKVLDQVRDLANEYLREMKDRILGRE